MDILIASLGWKTLDFPSSLSINCWAGFALWVRMPSEFSFPDVVKRACKLGHQVRAELDLVSDSNTGLPTKQNQILLCQRYQNLLQKVIIQQTYSNLSDVQFTPKTLRTHLEDMLL